LVEEEEAHRGEKKFPGRGNRGYCYQVGSQASRRGGEGRKGKYLRKGHLTLEKKKETSPSTWGW